MTFHSRSGFYFTREKDGSVRVRIAVGKLGEFSEWDDSTLREIVLPPNEWASVVASVEAGGEGGESYRRALERQVPSTGTPTTDPLTPVPASPSHGSLKDRVKGASND